MQNFQMFIGALGAKTSLVVAVVLILIGWFLWSNQDSRKIKEDNNSSSAKSINILVFTKTAGFKHDSIQAGVEAIKRLGEQYGFGVDNTSDVTILSNEYLAKYDAVVWLNTTGDVLNETQQAAFEQYIKTGKGYVGIHAAADTEYDWPWYGGLVGAYFESHPKQQNAKIKVEDINHVSTAHLPAEWSRFDEWYNFRANPRKNVHVLLSLDEGSYLGGTMGSDHPISWCHQYSGGRAWYTGLGHTKDSYAEPAFLQHLLGGIKTAAGAEESNCS